MLDTELRSEAEVVTEPVVGWRAWALSGDRDGNGLRLRPISSRAQPWEPRAPARAGCRLTRLHRAPDPECRCGLHATRTPHRLRWAKSPAVVGTIAMWGRIVEHEHGYRAELAYPQRLGLVCYVCFWQWGAGQARSDVVARLRSGRMLPLCGAHVETSNRYGFPVRNPLPAQEIEQALLSTYAVDMLRT